MRKARSQRHLYDFGAVESRLLQDRFKSGISGDECPARFSRECLCAELQNLAGTIAQQDLIVIHAVQFRQFLNQHIVVFIRVTAA